MLGLEGPWGSRELCLGAQHPLGAQQLWLSSQTQRWKIDTAVAWRAAGSWGWPFCNMLGGRRAAFCPWNKQSEPGNLILTASTGLGAVPSLPRLPAAGCAVCRSGSQDAVTACRSSAEPLASCCRVTAVSKNALVLPPCSRAHGLGGGLWLPGVGAASTGALLDGLCRAVLCRAELSRPVPSPCGRCRLRPGPGGSGSAA